MANRRRNSVDNMFAQKGSIEPHSKEKMVMNDVSKQETIEEPTQEVEETARKTELESEEVGNKSIEEIEIDENVNLKDDLINIEKSDENIPDSIDQLFNKKKRLKGRAQSVYLKKEVYDFCYDIANKYGLGISDVINNLILSVMKEN